jgi:hypothetical protein
MEKVGFPDRKTEESIRTVNYGSLPKSWPDVTREELFKHLGIKDNTTDAERRVYYRNAMAECNGPDCFLSGGKNKKKRYGRL